MPAHLQADDARARQSATCQGALNAPRAPHRQPPEYFAVYVEDDEGGEPEFICDLTASLPEQWQVPYALRPPPSARGTARAQRVTPRTPLSKRPFGPAARSPGAARPAHHRAHVSRPWEGRFPPRGRSGAPPPVAARPGRSPRAASTPLIAALCSQRPFPAPGPPPPLPAGA